MYIGVYVKRLLFLAGFNEILIFSVDFWKILKYQISWKSVQWKSSMQTDGHDETGSRFLHFCDSAQWNQSEIPVGLLETCIPSSYRFLVLHVSSSSSSSSSNSSKIHSVRIYYLWIYTIYFVPAYSQNSLSSLFSCFSTDSQYYASLNMRSDTYYLSSYRTSSWTPRCYRLCHAYETDKRYFCCYGKRYPTRQCRQILRYWQLRHHLGILLCCGGDSLTALLRATDLPRTWFQ